MIRLPATGLTLLVPILIVPSCSSKSEPAAVSADQAASDAANAFCSKVGSCVPALMQLQWGDVATCTAKYKGLLVGTLASTGTASTPADVESCAQAIPAASCDDVLGRNLPDICKAKAGTLTDGQACGDNSQCTGKLCKIANGQICGVCSTPTPVGGNCQSDDECDYGLKCAGAAAQRVCAARVGAGGTCDAAHPCVSSLTCKSGTCGTPDQVGTACVQGDETCDTAHAIICSGQTKMCAQATFAKAGGACGLVGGQVAVCEGGGSNLGTSCNGFAPPVSVMGTCRAPAADGAACNDMTGPTCISPSICVSGACKVKDPSSCR